MILILSNKSLNERSIHIWFKDILSSVILLTTEQIAAEMEPALQAAFAAVETVEKYDSQWIEVFADFLCQQYDVTYIVSSSEQDVIRVARIREKNNIPGQSLESAKSYRDKYLMKIICLESGIPIPPFCLIKKIGDLLNFIKKNGYPVVVKPRLGVGSKNIRIIYDEDGLHNFLKSGSLSAVPDTSGIWLVEKYIEGNFFHIDGLMRSGKVLHCWPSKYSSGNFESLRDAKLISSITMAEGDPITKELILLAKEVIAAFPSIPYQTSFHLEAWVTENGPVFCEIGSRTGGGYIRKEYYKAFGIDLTEQSMRGQAAIPLASWPLEPIRYVAAFLVPYGNGEFAPPKNSCPVNKAEISYKIPAGQSALKEHLAGESVAMGHICANTYEEAFNYLDRMISWWEEKPRWL